MLAAAADSAQQLRAWQKALLLPALAASSIVPPALADLQSCCLELPQDGGLSEASELAMAGLLLIVRDENADRTIREPCGRLLLAALAAAVEDEGSCAELLTLAVMGVRFELPKVGLEALPLQTLLCLRNCGDR
ncbi:unnamed protein product, partial [Symbiodinium pilosum]